ncbi:MAG TPA: DUF4290 domain-containing protein [Saprospiraceae bacterium]|nr:DUF4290 domain-containing protein [Saprospiraceae bacterium]HND86784.1 DUF4290 domain-containing protein [Saprospiraceae bacterium]HNG89605.1 DUF4290 domain-containing protein [Saprospiraceae bacterium]
MDRIDIEYNTERPDIRFPEYGRTIQEMLLVAKGIQERPKRQKTVEAIIQLMQLLNPVGNRNIEDYREKLWNHAFAIADYGLDVTPPPGITIVREDERPRAEPLGYPITATRFRHYGHGVQSLMQKAIEMPDGPKKEGFVEVIASYMKLAYKTWNKEHYVSDDIVREDLEILSDGQLSLHEGHSSLDTLAANAGKLEQRGTSRGGRRKRGGGGGGGGSRHKRNGNMGNNSGGGNAGNSGGGNRRKRKK